MPSGLASRKLAAALIGKLLASSTGAPPDDDADRLDARDERFAAELAHGVVRHLARLDWIVAQAAGTPVSRIAPAALTAARIGVFQLVFTPSVPPYAAVSTAVDLARALSPATAGFVNWLLRRVGPDAASRPLPADLPDHTAWLATYHSFPSWLARRWTKRLGGSDAGELMAAMNEHPSLHVRVNRLRASRDAVAAQLAEAGFAVEVGRYAAQALAVRGSQPLTQTEAFRAGTIYLQDESSQLAAAALAPQPGERVLDACAGVGGKTTQLAEIAGGNAAILALDNDRGRLARLAENVRRLGAAGVNPRHADLLDPATLAGERFDAVLLDAPCSALGTIPRHPEVKWSKRASDPARLGALQLRLIERCAALVSPGGRLAYSTCTTEPDEGEEVIARFLESHREFAVAPGASSAPAPPAALLTPEGFLRSWPHRHGIGGAFVALLTNTGG